MKQLIIIQQDEPYFLFETLQVLERNWASLSDFQVTILVDKASFDKTGGLSGLIKGITTDQSYVLSKKYDLSVNLSMNESSWVTHSDIRADAKIGAQLKDGQLVVNDIWSSYLLTLKARAPFLTFHLQHIYQNILGLKEIRKPAKKSKHFDRIVFSSFSIDIFPGFEQEKLVHAVNKLFPHCPILDISEVDPISNFSQTLYIGTASLEAVQICEYGARGIFLGSHFQGFNLLPSGQGHLLISSRGEKFNALEIEKVIKHQLYNDKKNLDSAYSLYSIETENLFGGYLRSLNTSDDNYPFYQSHLVLWNFLLSLFDTSLDIIRCSSSQVELIKKNKDILVKLIRLYDYAMSSINTIHTEAKASEPNLIKIQEHLGNLKEMDQLSDQISQSNSFLRPFLDFYRIRRGQNTGSNLFEQSQHTFLTYSEEHQALQALEELFSVTLQRNEVNI